MAGLVNLAYEDFALSPLQMRQAEYGQVTPGYPSAPMGAAPAAAPSTPAPPAGMPPLPPSLGGSPSAPAPAPTAPAPTPTPGNTQSPSVTPESAYDAFQAFKDSAGYQFAVDEAMRALNHGYAAGGQLQSGAAAKGIADYVQNMALQNYFFPYMNYLGGQQAMGAQSGAAIAGVGSNFGNTAANINANMGGAIQSGANALSNAAIANGVANANLWSGVGSSLGTIGSNLMNSSYSASPFSGGGGIPAGDGITPGWLYGNPFGGG